MLLHGDLWQGLLANLSVVTLLTLVWVQVMQRIERFSPRIRSTAFGLVMGVGAIIVMNMPFVSANGSRLDHRFTLIGISALFGGPISVLITAGITAIYRSAIGGPAVWVGEAGIAISVFVGLVTYYAKGRRERGFPNVLILSIAMPTAILGGLFTISPSLWATSTFEPTFALAVTIFLATFAVGWAILQEERRARDQHRISESEQRFRRAMEDSAIGMALVGLDGKILQTNRAFAQMLDYSVPELQQRTFLELTYPEDLAVGRETVKQALLGEIVSYQFEKRYVRKNGTPIWTLLAGSVIRDELTNEPLYLVSQIEDIDARKRSEVALVEAESRWSFALESAGQGVWDFNQKTQRTYYSPVWKKIVGYEDHELTNDPDLWLTLMHPDDRDGIQAIDEAYKTGLTPHFEAEFRMKHKDGRWIWVSDRGKVLERDANGAAVRAIGTHTDITQQKEAEDRLALSATALAEEKERLRITLHSIADAVICTDAGNRVTFMNPTAEVLTGFDIVTAYGEPLETVFAPVDEETGALVKLVTSVDSGSSWSGHGGRAVLVRRDDTRRNIREVVSPILTAKADFAGSVIVFQDVTDARALQRDLAYAASHDPLTGLANRSGFIRSLVEVLGLAAENGSEHALLFIDLDRFKAVNDTAGHLAGDALLKLVARAIKGCVRSHDNVSRFGGDEFAVLLRSSSLEVAFLIAESIVVAVRDLRFTWDEQGYQIGASIGITLIDRHARAMDEIVAQADEACYASKKAGRGCVSVFSGTTAQALAI